MPGWAFHCPLGGLFSRCWVDRPRVPGAREGRKARGPAGRALGPGQAPTVSSERQAIWDAGHLQTRRTGIGPPAQERKWRRGRPRTGPGKASEGRSGRVAQGVRVLQQAPSSEKQVAGPALRAGLRVCACACMCSRVRTHLCARLGALSAHPGAQVNRFPTRSTGDTGGQDLVRWCEPPARLQADQASIRTVLAARPWLSHL